ncbi:MAG: hypothetical protein KGJ58_00020 [Patescibacteria group bacterium]|nr:hypothetical protein [Patescibacteria group bacterium]MDE1988516.1 hypothetical protein [Patescibacteria group bacterium]MDE2217829.1 hypothetical protein [Patescibacteria group bacterium]
MCEGETTDPVPTPRKSGKMKKSFFRLLMDYFVNSYRITDADYLDSPNSPKVNMCLDCGDLEIDDEWRRIPCPHRTSIKNSVVFGGIIISGSLKVCDLCASIKKEIKEKRKNLYEDSYPDFEQVKVSSLSF